MAINWLKTMQIAMGLLPIIPQAIQVVETHTPQANGVAKAEAVMQLANIGIDSLDEDLKKDIHADQIKNYLQLGLTGIVIVNNIVGNWRKASAPQASAPQVIPLADKTVNSATP